MNTFTTKDGTQIYYKDWGTGRPVVFSHGWPLSADAWEGQMVFLATNYCRCIAHDRRGHGRSTQPWNGNDMDTYADDLSELIETLDLNSVTLVGHSAGGGEVARYIGRHGTKRVARVVLVSAVPPLMLQTHANPGGLPLQKYPLVVLAPVPGGLDAAPGSRAAPDVQASGVVDELRCHGREPCAPRAIQTGTDRLTTDNRPGTQPSERSFSP
jgi:pimeloyl-ACP methyl ester carboxylesterase